ncbi:MAG: Hsp33 family molecular chaperone HslO [Gammaproteobacteria bacterium]|nr:Hsp33 family molecular chaperone HslO [Gammaproteobacteria bacterium]
MRDRDSLHRFIIENSRVRGELIHLDASWKAVLERNEYPERVKKQLGDALAAVALLSATIKYKGKIILQIRGDGPLHFLVVQATSDNTVRGIARWQSEVPEGALKEVFGNATMVITIEPEKGESYQGIVELKGDALANGIEAYFQQSEQLPTRLWLASDNNSCAGFLLQELPGDQNNSEDWEHHEHLAATLQDNELLELGPQELLHRLYHEENVRLFDSEVFSFRCGCSRQRIDKMLQSLGYQEVNQTLEENAGIVAVDCEFCNAHYEYDAVDVDQLFGAEHQPEGPTTLQ